MAILTTYFDPGMYHRNDFYRELVEHLKREFPSLIAVAFHQAIERPGIRVDLETKNHGIWEWNDDSVSSV